MPFTKDEILELMTKAKELGLAQIKVEGFEATLAQTTAPQVIQSALPPPDRQELKAEDIFKALPEDDPINDDELVKYYATPYYDVLIAEREARQKAIKESRVTNEPAKEPANG